jgi:hypothetical protein
MAGCTVRIRIQSAEDALAAVAALKKCGYKVPKGLSENAEMVRSITIWPQMEVTYCTRFKVRGVQEIKINQIPKHTRALKGPRKRCQNKGRQVARIDPNTGQQIAVYSTVREAADDLCVRVHHIYACANDKIKTAYGYNWAYL